MRPARLALAILIAPLAAPAPALAAEPAFVPERPGFGQFPGSPGRGFFMVEGAGALSLPSDGLRVGTDQVTVRIGLHDHAEVRLGAPDLTLGDGLTVGPIALGTKLGGYVNDRLGLAIVPELLIPLDGGAVGWRNRSTVTVEAGKLRQYTLLDVRYLDALSAFGGVGALYRFGTGGLFGQVGSEVQGRALVGGGGLWRLHERVQLDAGCDVWLDGGSAEPVFRVGASGAF